MSTRVVIHAEEGSLSLRRAWIEILDALLATAHNRGRSPYGERGLKYAVRRPGLAPVRVALLTESVD